MTVEQVKEIVKRVRMTGPFMDKWIHVGDLREIADPSLLASALPDLGVAYVQVRYMEADIYPPHHMAEQRARVWVIPPDASESQVVQICFGAHLASAEHQVREFFTYEVDGAQRRVFGPHMDIADLGSVAR